MMGFPALSSLTSNTSDDAPDPSKQTLFGFPTQKAGAPTAPALQEDSESDLYDEGEATSLIPAAQLQKEFEAQSSMPAQVEVHSPRATVAGIPVSEFAKAPQNIKSAWGMEEDSDFNSESTSVISAGAIFEKEQEVKAGFSKRVENMEFPTSSTLMGMSITDFEKGGPKPEENARSTQFAMPAVQFTDTPKPGRTPFKTPQGAQEIITSVPDDGPESGELSTQMWNPLEETTGSDQAEHRAFLEKLRSGNDDDGKGTRMGMPAISGARTTAENAKPAAATAPQGPQPGKAPSLPAPSTSNTDSLRQRLQDRLKGAVPPPSGLGAAAAKPAVPAPSKTAEEPFEKAVIDLSDLSVEPLKPATPKPSPLEASIDDTIQVVPEAKAPRSLASSGVLGKHTYVVSKNDEPAAPKPAAIGRIVERPATAQAPAVQQPEAPTPAPNSPHSVATKAPMPLLEDDDDFAFADTGIASADLLAKINVQPAPTPIFADADPFEAAAPAPSQPLTGSGSAVRDPAPTPGPTPALNYPPQEDTTDPQFPPAAFQGAPQTYAEPAPAYQEPAAPVPAAPAITAATEHQVQPQAQQHAPQTTTQQAPQGAPGTDPLVAKFQMLFALLGSLLLLAGAAVAGLAAALPVAGGLGLLAVILAAATFALPQSKRGVAWVALGVIISVVGAVILVLDLSVIAGACAIGGGFAAIAGFVLGKLLG